MLPNGNLQSQSGWLSRRVLQETGLGSGRPGCGRLRISVGASRARGRAQELPACVPGPAIQKDGERGAPTSALVQGTGVGLPRDRNVLHWGPGMANRKGAGPGAWALPRHQSLLAAPAWVPGSLPTSLTALVGLTPADGSVQPGFPVPAPALLAQDGSGFWGAWHQSLPSPVTSLEAVFLASAEGRREGEEAEASWMVGGRDSAHLHRPQMRGGPALLLPELRVHLGSRPGDLRTRCTPSCPLPPPSLSALLW